MAIEQPQRGHPPGGGHQVRRASFECLLESRRCPIRQPQVVAPHGHHRHGDRQVAPDTVRGVRALGLEQLLERDLGIVQQRQHATPQVLPDARVARIIGDNLEPSTDVVVVDATVAPLQQREVDHRLWVAGIDAERLTELLLCQPRGPERRERHPPVGA